MKYEILLFDLDGTLTDPKEGITKSVAYALSHFGIEVHDLDELIPFIGPPLVDSFMEFYGFERGKALEAVEKYREYFKDRGIFQNRVFAGIPEVLERLRKEGKILILATAKPEVFAKRIMEHFDLAQYFHAICGSELSGSRIDKASVIDYALDSNGIAREEASLAKVLMIGDRKHDIEGAHQHGIACAAVLYGYGDQEELTQAGADYMIKDLDELWMLG